MLERVEDSSYFLKIYQSKQNIKQIFSNLQLNTELQQNQSKQNNRILKTAIFPLTLQASILDFEMKLLTLIYSKKTFLEFKRGFLKYKLNTIFLNYLYACKYFIGKQDVKTANYPSVPFYQAKPGPVLS